jgi:hypothetical protein
MAITVSSSSFSGEVGRRAFFCCEVVNHLSFLDHFWAPEQETLGCFETLKLKGTHLGSQGACGHDLLLSTG